MKHVFLLTDFSETARHAALYALTVFEGRDFHFHLLNAYDVEFSGSPYITRVKEEMAEESRKGLRRELAVLHQQFPNVAINVVSRYGPLVDVLLREGSTEFTRPDFLVMGCRGESALENFLLGSTAFDVIKHVQLPVLAIPLETPLQKPRKIVYATDLKTLNQEMAKPLFELVSAFHSELLFAHVLDNEYLNHLEAEERIAAYFPGIKLSFHFLDGEDVCRSVCDFSEEQGADLVAMVRHNYSFFERLFHPSVTRKMVLHPQYPMFVLHAGKPA